jgi:hypothetical protein
LTLFPLISASEVLAALAPGPADRGGARVTLDGDQGRGAGGQHFLELLFDPALDPVLGELGEQRSCPDADGCRGEQRGRAQTDYGDERVARGT